ncbi:MAG: DUF4388 domain-containing protein [Candidatus Obscuribacterales bacterium]|nr:DUF4388 domain-containing protein [Candidatus Obscuribacterales bacterium]
MKEGEEVTLRLADSVVHESVLVLKYGPNFIAELTGLNKSKRKFDVVIVDSTESGFLFSAEHLIEASQLAKSLLEVQGALVFVKHDKAAALVKESPVGYLSFHVFESFSAVYDYSSTMAKHIQQAMGQGIELNKESGDLSEQVLMTIIPVLTMFGIKLKGGSEGTKRRNKVLAAIDNYTPLSSIAQRLSQQLSFDEMLEELRGMEKIGAIYPIFPKIPFLVHHFRNSRPFKLKDYLVEARMLTREQLDDIIATMQNSKSAQRLSMGSLCVAKGLISARQLEIALQDQAFFGQVRDTEKNKFRITPEPETRVQSLIGHLGTTEPAGVLQNLNTNRCHGVLSVEHRDRSFRALFEQGKLVCAKQGRLRGNAAVTEFVSVWQEGVYVFIERQPPPDLADDANKVTRPLDKLLLDSALCADNIEANWKKFPKGVKSSLEKIADTGNLLGSQLMDPQENVPLSAEEMELMRRIWKMCDGLSTIDELIRKLGDITTLQGAMAIGRLLHYGLIKSPETELGGPLSKFRAIIAALSQRIGIDRSEALLRIALRESMGYSAVARVFSIGANCEIGAEIAAAKTAGLSLSMMVKALEDWQVKYIEHVSQEVDKTTLRDIVYRVYQGK